MTRQLTQQELIEYSTATASSFLLRSLCEDLPPQILGVDTQEIKTAMATFRWRLECAGQAWLAKITEPGDKR